jgi:DNA-binding transcriptional LysR family regulator
LSASFLLSLLPEHPQLAPKHDIIEVFISYALHKENFEMQLNLDHLRTFACVIDVGSFSAAAGRLGLSQPAVSLQLKQLERRLGIRLIERVGRRATPTAAGEELLSHARRIDATVANAFEAMARYAQGTVGRVRIGTGATACIYFLPPVLRQLRARFPSLDIVVSTGNTPDVLKAIEANAIDVGLVTLPSPGRMFDIKPVIADEFVVVSAIDGGRLPRRITPSDLANLPVVLYESGAHARLLIDQWALRAGHSLKPVMELGSVEAIKELVGAGLGCGVVPRMAIRDADARTRISVHPLYPRLFRKLAIVLRHDKPLQKALREVVNAVKLAAGEFARSSSRPSPSVRAKRPMKQHVPVARG